MSSDNLEEVLRELHIENLNEAQKDILRDKIYARIGLPKDLETLKIEAATRGHDLSWSELLQLQGIIEAKVGELEALEAPQEVPEVQKDTQSVFGAKQYPQTAQIQDQSLALRSSVHSSPYYLNPRAPESPRRVLARVEAARAAAARPRPPSPHETFTLTNSIFINSTSHHDGAECGVVKGIGGEWYVKLPESYPGYAEVLHDVRNAALEAVVQHQVVTYCNVQGVPAQSFPRLHRTRLLCSRPPQQPSSPARRLYNSLTASRAPPETTEIPQNLNNDSALKFEQLK